MAETSRSQVTITLGRSGQVVKRAGAVLDNEFSEPIPGVGSKRSVRDRLGGSVDALQLDNKRLHGDNGSWNFKASKSLDDLRLSKDDLRFKIMKRAQSNSHHNMVDLRDMLSRPARSTAANPVNSYSMHETRHGIQRVLEPRHMPDPRHERQSMPEPRDDRPRGPVSRDDRPHGPISRDERPRGLVSRDDIQRMAEPIDGRQGMHEPHEVRDRVSKLDDVRPRVAERPMTGQYTSLRTSPRMGFLGDPYSPWTLDHIRRKSPGGLSPQRRRTYEDSRSVAYGSEISRPTSFLTKPPLSVGPMKPLAAPTLPPAATTQRTQYPVEPSTVEGFLRSLGLEKYLISFKVEEVDMSALSQMGDRDLKELGIPMGPRKKILLALVARSRQPQHTKS